LIKKKKKYIYREGERRRMKLVRKKNRTFKELPKQNSRPVSVEEVRRFAIENQNFNIKIKALSYWDQFIHMLLEISTNYVRIVDYTIATSLDKNISIVQNYS
jgi:hypothetical protein